MLSFSIFYSLWVICLLILLLSSTQLNEVMDICVFISILFCHSLFISLYPLGISQSICWRFPSGPWSWLLYASPPVILAIFAYEYSSSFLFKLAKKYLLSPKFVISFVIKFVNIISLFLVTCLIPSFHPNSLFFWLEYISNVSRETLKGLLPFVLFVCFLWWWWLFLCLKSS